MLARGRDAQAWVELAEKMGTTQPTVTRLEAGGVTGPRTVRFEAQAFVEIIEQTYVSFKRAIELMVMNTSCECNACANIGNLDLKFFVHHGEFALQVLGNSKELVGSDVILIHRLMKNTVTESTGIRA